MSLFVVDTAGAVKLRRRKDVVLDTPSCDALSAHRRGTQVLPKHRAFVVGDSATFAFRSNQELEIEITAIFEDHEDNIVFMGVHPEFPAPLWGRVSDLTLYRPMSEKWIV